jgi:hypothetical protein
MREQAFAADRAVAGFKAKNTNIIAQVPNEAEITLRGLESSASNYRTFYDNLIQNIIQRYRMEAYQRLP